MAPRGTPVASAAAVLVGGRIRLAGSPGEAGKGLSGAYLGAAGGSGPDPLPRQQCRDL